MGERGHRSKRMNGVTGHADCHGRRRERLQNPLVTSTDSRPTPRLLQAIKTEYSYRTRTGMCRRVEAEERGGDTPMGVNEPSIVVPSTR